MVDLTQYFPSWGDSGEAPPSGTDYQSGDNPKAQHYDWLWDKLNIAFNTVETRLNDIDSDDDGVVDEADYANDSNASTYKGNDIDSDGDGTVDQADEATNVSSTYKGNDIDSDGDGTVDEADYANDADASTYKGNDIDSDGDGKVDNATEVNGSRITVSDTAPSNPEEGDIWVDTSAQQ